MKHLLFTPLFFISIIGFSQKKTIKILEANAGPISLSYSMNVDLEKQDTLFYVYIGFQNAKYTTLTDIKSLFFTQDDVLKQFIKELSTALNELEKNEKIEMLWDRSPNYKLQLYEFSKSLYVIEGKGTGGYTNLTKKQIASLIESLSKIERIGSLNVTSEK